MSNTFDINKRPPFDDPVACLGVQRYDVLRVKNVPFAVSIAEIKAFVGRLSASPLILEHSDGFPVHIVMERPTGKTMDCYVEFKLRGAAAAAVKQAEQLQFEGKGLKIGPRHLEVELSNEGELCAALFPRAKCVEWDPSTGVPTVLSNEDPFSEGFRGFITDEELAGISRTASNPQRVPFSQRCPQRVYESMISTLYKYPWHVPVQYTVNNRRDLFNIYIELLKILMAQVQPGSHQSMQSANREVGINHSLLMSYLFTGVNVPMFSIRQKLVIAHEAGSLGGHLNLPVYAFAWPFHTLTPSVSCSPRVIGKWLEVLDIGIHKVLNNRIRHGYENHLRVRRAESSSVMIDILEEAWSFQFHDLIAMELGLMRILVEHGRSEWCSHFRVPYAPIRSWIQPTQSPSADELEISTHKQEFAQSSGETTQHAFYQDGGALARLAANDFREPAGPPTVRGTAVRFAEATEGVGEMLGSSTSPVSFDPSTPAFVPSQLSTATGGSRQPQFHYNNLAQTNRSTWNPQEARGLMTQSGRSHLDPALDRKKHKYKASSPHVSLGHPFSGEASSQTPRSDLYMENRRYPLAHANKAGPIAHPSSDAKYGQGSSAQHRPISAASASISHSSISSLWGTDQSDSLQAPWTAPGVVPPQPGFVNTSGGSPSQTSIWANQDYARTLNQSTPLDSSDDSFTYPRGSGSYQTVGSAGVSISAVGSQNSTTPTRVLSAFGQSNSHSPSGSLNQPQRIWQYSSPARGSVSRSSTGRNSIRIQPTIDEEVEDSDDETTIDANTRGVGL